MSKKDKIILDKFEKWIGGLGFVRQERLSGRMGDMAARAEYRPKGPKGWIPLKPVRQESRDRRWVTV